MNSSPTGSTVSHSIHEHKSNVCLQPPEHLAMQSPYSRMMACDAHKGILAGSNMPVKSIPKSRLDDSCLDVSYETPAKRPYIPSIVSPDVGLGCDSLIVDARTQTKDTLADVKSRLNLSSSSVSCSLHEGSGSDQSAGSPPNSISSANGRRALSELHNVFRFNINPKLCQSALFKTEQAGITAIQAQRLTTEQQVGEGQEGRQTEEPSTGRKSKGKRASYNAKDGSGDPHSHSILKSPLGSSPLLKPLSPYCHQLLQANRHAPPRRNRTVVVAVDKFVSVPLFDSAVCGGRSVSPVGEKPTVESRSRDRWPLRVHVATPAGNAVAVTVNHQPSKVISQAPPERRTRRVSSWSERDWYNNMRRYMDSVSIHFRENHRPDSTVSELMSLMASVAGPQHNKHWQHPSDLTKRNYQERFGNLSPRMSLAEWKARNSKHHPGFSVDPERFRKGSFS